MAEPQPGTVRTVLRMFNLRRGLDDPDSIDTSIRDGVQTFGTNLWVLILAMLVASVGLDVNSTAVIIGAMLISPLMGPIVGVGYGLAIQDGALIRKAALTLGVFTAVSLVSSTLYFSLSPLEAPGSELLARTQPTLWDVLIAFFGGSAGIIALTRRSFSNVLPGVAIATALMPPLCTVGYSIANGRWAWAGGALYLYAINGVFIAFATLVFVKLMRLPLRADLPARSLAMSRLFTALTLAAMVVPSSYFAWELVRTQRDTQRLVAAIDAAVRLADVAVIEREIRQDGRRVTLTIAGAARPEELERQLKAATAADPRLARTEFDVRSVTAPQLDLETIRSALGADLARAAAAQDEQVRAQRLALEDRQQAAERRQAELRQLGEELRAQYPSLAVAEVAETHPAPGEPAAASRVLVLLSDDPALGRGERERVQRWLAARLPGSEVTLGYVPRGPRTPPR